VSSHNMHEDLSELKQPGSSVQDEHLYKTVHHEKRDPRSLARAQDNVLTSTIGKATSGP
jgi:hypothetical protein